MKKGEIISGVQVTSMAAEGKCVARIDGKVIFIEGAAPGDIVDVSLTKIKASFLEGKVTDIIKESANRTTPFCEHFGIWAAANGSTLTTMFNFNTSSNKCRTTWSGSADRSCQQ
jgi:tRNA/tmRNA/rRNA uracil-C5-methylase (TrmA/RlmC/RlmD family)